MSNYLNKSFDLENPEFISVIDELPLWSAPFGLRLLNEIKYRKNITAIDIGSGLGFPLLEVAMRLGTTCKVYGIDPWLQAIERTERKIHYYRINNVELITGEAENIPLPDSSVDLIISNNGINNVKDPDKTFSEISRIAKPGAQFVFTFNTDKTMIEFYKVFENVLREKNLIYEIKKLKDHIYEKRKPVEEVVNSLMRHNFSINLVDHDEFQYVYTDGTTMFNHFLIRLAFIDSWKKIIPENLIVEVFEKVESGMNDLSTEKGSLKITIPFAIIDSVKTA
jgi:arsenite methyltransferase